MKVPIPCDKIHEQRTGGDICPYCEIARLREALKWASENMVINTCAGIDTLTPEEIMSKP